MDKIITKALDDASRWGMEQVPNEIHRFAQYVANQKLHHVVEIGVRRGGTVALWHNLCSGIVVGIDLEDGVVMDEYRGNTIERHKELKEAYPRFRSIIGNSHFAPTFEQVQNVLNGEKIDLLFIDGDHSAAGSMQDYKIYGQLVKNGGLIAFHDIVDTALTKSVNCRVCETWSKIGGYKFEINEHGSWGGIGVIRQ
jgi:predicted O-methyltransferase YrrM